MYTEDVIFEDHSFVDKPLPAGEYEGCTFRNCDFSETDLSGYSFIDCQFYDSNLSLAKLTKTVFRDIFFSGCKLTGLHFEDCGVIAFAANDCIFNHSTFFKIKLKKTTIINSQLLEADFTACDLTGSTFSGCDLNRTVFDGTILEKVDFRNAFNYTIDPEKNGIKKAKFSVDGLPGLLRKYNIDIESIN